MDIFGCDIVIINPFIYPVGMFFNIGILTNVFVVYNITTDEYPMGVYHPHDQYHHIKKENIGLIEVMGLAVLPARLKNEIAQLEDAILNHKDIRENTDIEKHADWVDEWIDGHVGDKRP